MDKKELKERQRGLVCSFRVSESGAVDITRFSFDFKRMRKEGEILDSTYQAVFNRIVYEERVLYVIDCSKGMIFVTREIGCVYKRSTLRPPPTSLGCL